MACRWQAQASFCSLGSMLGLLSLAGKTGAGVQNPLVTL